MIRGGACRRAGARVDEARRDETVPRARLPLPDPRRKDAFACRTRFFCGLHACHAVSRRVVSCRAVRCLRRRLRTVREHPHARRRTRAHQTAIARLRCPRALLPWEPSALVRCGHGTGARQQRHFSIIHLQASAFGAGRVLID